MIFIVLAFVLINFPFILITKSFEMTIAISLVISYLLSCLITFLVVEYEIIWPFYLRKKRKQVPKKWLWIILILMLIIVLWFTIVIIFGWYHCQFVRIYDGLIYETCRGFTYNP